jgi:hypothetical protein
LLLEPAAEQLVWNKKNYGHKPYSNRQQQRRISPDDTQFFYKVFEIGDIHF